MAQAAHDWQEWHTAYDRPGTPLVLRLAVVQQCIRAAFDAAPAGPIRIVSMCAGEGRDVLGVLEDHPRRGDVQGRLVELDPVLADTARAHAPAGVEVLCADAGTTASYAGAVPADLVIVCGVFGNITDADIMHTIDELPTLCAPGASVIWTRHRRPPDATPEIRARFAHRGFEELAFHTPPDTMFCVGRHRLAGPTQPFQPDARLFDFVGYKMMESACPPCGFSYRVGRAEITPWLRTDAQAFIEKLATFDDTAVRTRPEPDVWSPLEYACHVRDMLAVQTDRVMLAQREVNPVFVPMGRDELVVEDRYNEQDPQAVAAQLSEAAETFAALLDGLDDAGWERTGMYNYPEPALRTVEWIAIHTTHELLHHRGDLR